jgi:dolichyl-phosphate beta-glucosyltransferase
MMAPQQVALVVPCFNEADRWQHGYWQEIVNDPLIRIFFVDDGSTDLTSERIKDGISHDSSAIQVLTLQRNEGKAEAVRNGLLTVLAQDAGIVAFLDADAAFPAEEVIRLAHLSMEMLNSDHSQWDAVWSSRIMLGGRDIKRRSSRHYISRAIATVVAPMHGYEIYDTQSGYKIFRASKQLEACLREPFKTRWFPDVELLQRWTRITGNQMRIWEEPVIGWQDMAGSKMNRSQYLQLIRDGIQLHRHRLG